MVIFCAPSLPWSSQVLIVLPTQPTEVKNGRVHKNVKSSCFETAPWVSFRNVSRHLVLNEDQIQA